jgi:DNA-binding MarR family transcriptional regulator
MAGKQSTANLLYKLTTLIAEELDKEMPITQIMAFARIAHGGDAGVDQGKLQEELSMSSAGASRTIQALSKIHYHKDKPGYDVVERIIDGQDNRRRTLKLTAKGERIMAKIQALLS